MPFCFAPISMPFFSRSLPIFLLPLPLPRPILPAAHAYVLFLAFGSTIHGPWVSWRDFVNPILNSSASLLSPTSWSSCSLRVLIFSHWEVGSIFFLSGGINFGYFLDSMCEFSSCIVEV
jgi:hypothetical protein